MNNKTKVIIVVIALVTSFAVGRWAAPTKIVTKTIEVEKKVIVKDDKKDTRKHRSKKTVVVVTPDGTKTTTIVDNTDTDTKQENKDKTTDDIKKDSETTKEYSSSKVTVSALGALNLKTGLPAYGAAVSKPILGPLTIGAFGLTDTTFGVSVGLTF